MPLPQTQRPNHGQPPPLPPVPPDLQSSLIRESLGHEVAGRRHDGTGWLVLAFTLCVLSVGWGGYFQPEWSPSEMLGGGNDSSELNEEDSPMIDLQASTPETAPQEEVPPVEPEVVPEMEEMPEEVPVVDTVDAFTVPAPPEIVQPLRITEPRPERPRPPTTPKPRAAPSTGKPAGPPSTAAAGGSSGGSGGGSGTGQGKAKGKKAKTPQPPYPGFARSGRMTGTVVLSIVVDEAGGVIAANVARSCGFPQLDSYTSNYIRRNWRWPEGVRRTFTQPVSYRLR